jgi:hypothetical protein
MWNVKLVARKIYRCNLLLYVRGISSIGFLLRGRFCTPLMDVVWSYHLEF